MHRLNWDDLRFLLAVAEQGTLSGAARRLGVNHATVYRRVSEFEKSLGVTLFERRPNGYAIAGDARHILDSLRAVERSVQGVERSVTGLAADIEGTVRITSTDSLCEAVLVGVIRDLQSLHPALHVELQAGNNHVNLARLDADIAIRPARALPDDLSGEKAGEMTFLVFGAPAYLARKPAGKPGQGAPGHDWLGVTEPLVRSPVGQWLEDEAGEEAIVFRSNSFLTLRDAAEAGMGLAMLPAFLGDRSETLTRVDAFPTVLRTDVWVAAHRDRRRSRRIRFLMGYFADALRGRKALLTGDAGPAHRLSAAE